MQKGKTWQRVASAVLAVMMTMSTFSSTRSYGDGPGFLMMKRKKTESDML